MEKSTKPAGFWRRVVSFFIDAAIAAPIFYACIQLKGEVLQEVVFTLIFIVYYTLFMSSSWRATPGMRVTKIEAVGADGKPLSKAHAVYWCVASSLFACLAFAPVLYLQWWIVTYDVAGLIGAVDAGQITSEAFSMELQVRTGMNTAQMQGLFVMCLAVSAVLCFIWALSIVLSKRKIGWHNWLSATRFVVRAS